ncbi:hypothetical protein F4825DRAFT_452690 [Nemania diffusa]|nr:hypothetical protein F4825DRAFT_452690 [Nemania diffusa]
MPPTKQPSAETNYKVATLRAFLQQPNCRQRVAPLVTALMARDVDFHERLLTDLRNRVQKIGDGLDSESEHAGQVLERINNIEQDAKGLRQLVQGDEQRAIEARADYDQLKAELTDAIAQLSAEMTSLGSHLQVIEGAIDGQRQTATGVKETLDTTAQIIGGLQADINVLKGSIENMPFATQVSEVIEKLEEKIRESFDRSSETIEHLTLSLPTIKNNMDIHEDSAYGRPVQGAIDKSLQNQGLTLGLGHSTTIKEHETSKQPKLQSWPAIAEFLAIYEHFIGMYKSTKVDNEPQFIKTFLNEINIHSSCALQRHLLNIYPKKVTLRPPEVSQQPPNIFIELLGMRWKDIRRAIPKIHDLRSLQWAVNEGISGPTQAYISQQ